MEKKNVIISITGTQVDDEGEDTAIELITSGEFEVLSSEYRFSYMESELTGLAGTKTSITVNPMGVIMQREGTLNSCMIFEEGKKHNFVYDTPFGATTMGIDTRRVKNNIGANGGDLEIDYSVDFQQNLVGHNKFIFNVREENI